LHTVWLGTGLILAGLTMHQWDMLKGGPGPTTVE
jgi:hypothetical protein